MQFGLHLNPNYSEEMPIMSNESNITQMRSSQDNSYFGRAIKALVGQIPPSILVSRTWDSERIAKEASRRNASR